MTLASFHTHGLGTAQVMICSIWDIKSDQTFSSKNRHPSQAAFVILVFVFSIPDVKKLDQRFNPTGEKQSVYQRTKGASLTVSHLFDTVVLVAGCDTDSSTNNPFFTAHRWQYNFDPG